MRLLNGALAMMMGVSAASVASAATISSTDFSIGYGFSDGTWNTTETSDDNTLLSGDYDIAISVGGTQNSPSGPTFNDRILANGTFNGVGRVSTFGVTATGSYTGSAPGAAPDPDYQVQINITAIKIYAAPFSPDGGETLHFNETTVGHLSSQSAQSTPYSGPVTSASSYTQVDWNPDDYFSPVDTTSQTRTFSLTEFTLQPEPDYLALDGFEIEGNIVVSYNQIPEPASLGLIGLAGLVACRRR